MGKKLAIKGDSTLGKKVIELLEMMGGKNIYYYDCDIMDYSYYVCGGAILCDRLSIEDDDFVIFYREEFWEKYPYKVGDVIKFPNNMAEEIAEMKWDEELEDIVYTSVSGWTRPCSVPKNTNNKTNMKNMFIEFDNTLINTNHIIYIENLDGAYNNSGKFAVRCITDKNIKCEWYNTKKQRNERYEYLVNLLSIK